MAQTALNSHGTSARGPALILSRNVAAERMEASPVAAQRGASVKGRPRSKLQPLRNKKSACLAAWWDNGELWSAIGARFGAGSSLRACKHSQRRQPENPTNGVQICWTATHTLKVVHARSRVPAWFGCCVQVVWTTCAKRGRQLLVGREETFWVWGEGEKWRGLVTLH